MTTAPTTVRFTEEMKGYVSFGADDPESGLREGEAAGNFFMFHLTIETVDIDRFYREPDHAGVATGWVRCDQLGGTLQVEEGVFNLFVDSDNPREREMRYRLHFTDGVGNPLTFTGVKHVEDHPGFDVWSDTSTLYSKVLQGHVGPTQEDEVPVVAAGILRILKRDFARQLTTFRANGPSFGAKVRGFLLFSGLFLGKLFDVYVLERLGFDPPGS